MAAWARWEESLVVLRAHDLVTFDASSPIGIRNRNLVMDAVDAAWGWLEKIHPRAAPMPPSALGGFLAQIVDACADGGHVVALFLVNFLDDGAVWFTDDL